MQALVFGFAEVVCTKHCLQRIGIVRDDLAPVDQAHALRSRLGSYGILNLEPQLFHGSRCGQVLQMNATFDLAGRR
jgi:hypothetical protein